MLARFLLIALCFSPGVFAAEPPVMDSKLHLSGRWDVRQPDRAITVNSGSYVVARFESGSIAAKFDVTRNKPPMPTIAWRVDEDLYWRESEIAPSVELAKDLPAGPHQIMLSVRGIDEHQPRWAEPLTGSLTFLGFDLAANGKLLDPPATPKLKIEFLGDSITEGVRVHPIEPGKETWSWQSDALRAYASQTGMKLGAEWRQTGFGRLGIGIEGSGGVPIAPDSFDWFYAGCPRDSWQADVVVINMGTNDGGIPSAPFQAGYTKYLATIRKAYPKAKLLTLRPFNGAHADDIKAVLAAMGDANISFVDTKGWLEPSDFTDGVHPNVGAGPKLAEKLAKMIASTDAK